MASAPVTRAPDRSMDIDSSDVTHQLQGTLESSCHFPNPHSVSYSSRKHGWNASRSSLESDFLSEVSGQFDDADEPASPLPGHNGVPAGADAKYSPSSHSVKRRRSNDWPRQPGDNNDSTARREQHTPSGSRQRWPFGHYYGKLGGSMHGSPRSPRHGRGGRRSRFVEGHMNDTVSEKPPSIFFRDEARNNETARGASRQSGVFRFGKAIASAFNPFGGWGSVSEIWRGSHGQDENRPQEAADDRLRQVEAAYEELKRSGYQGTAKGSYIQSLGAGGASIPEGTWRSIREKMDYGGANGGGGQHSRQSSGNAPGNESASGSSLRSSLPDLRKAKSSLAIPSTKKSDGMSSSLQHIDDRGQEVRRQKSRKDMQRQAKLLKRVSNLEEKLERARRELRELSGEEELLMPSNLNEERPYQRKFVPGALPSLPSERLLHDSEPTTPLSPLANSTLHLLEPEEQSQPQIRLNKLRLIPPAPWRKASHPVESRPISASRKRKSPDPESRKKPIQFNQQQPTEETPIPEPSETEQNATPADVTKPPSRKPKLPKIARGDSPGSVERKQKQKRSPVGENRTSPAEERALVAASRPLRSTTRNRSATPVLRMKRGRGDLRSTTSPSPGPSPGPGEDKENQHSQGEYDGDGDGDDSSYKLELDQQNQDPEADPQNTATPTPSRRKARHEYIPPVPPLPKDLAATAAKVDRRLAREMGKRRGQSDKDGRGGEGFQWPEDIF